MYSVENEEEVIKAFLVEELTKFENIQDPTTIASYKTVMTDDRPIKQKYFFRNPAIQGIIDAEI